MDDSTDSAAVDSTLNAGANENLPPGDHPLEIAAREGFGPLSTMADDVWHGEAVPCVSCGQLVRRTQNACDDCGQDLSERMLAKMRAHSGPWYVLEHLHPFPGVTLDRIIRQIRRGVLTETSIVRGPATDHQWNFAVETPGLCRYFGRCWHCHNEVAPSDSTCTRCRSHLNFEQHEDVLHQTATSKRTESSRSAVLEPTLQIRELSAALGRAGVSGHELDFDAAPRIGRFRASWVSGILVVLVIIVLVWVTSVRRNTTTTPGQPKSSEQTTAVEPSTS